MKIRMPRPFRRRQRIQWIALLLIAVTVTIGWSVVSAQHKRPPLIQQPGFYPYDMGSTLLTEKERPHDSAGIIMVRYPSGVHYNPVTVSQAALAHYDHWLREKDEASRTQFLKYAVWLRSTQADNGLWYYDFPNGAMPVPWVSAMAQGHAISVFVRAYALTNDDSYLEAADRSLGTFEIAMGRGGVNDMDGNFVYYEEAMPPESPHILNGAARKGGG